MSSTEQYHITPEQVDGLFTIKKMTDFAEDDYAYLFVDLPEGERCIIYNYPPEDGDAIRALTLPARCIFDANFHLQIVAAYGMTGDCPE